MICIIFATGLTACAFNKIKIPAGSADYLNQSYVDVVNELQEAGFKDIQTTAIDDLTSDNKDKDGTIESISVGEVKEFEAEQKFNPDDPIMIEYHNLPKLSLPAEIKDIQAMTFKEIADAFTDAGFINVSTEEVYDLDPDTESAEHVNEVLIDESADFSADDEVPFDANVIVRVHYKYKKYTAKINIVFMGNFIFSKYDVSMLIDGEKQKELPHGEDSELELRLKEGEHEISFQKIDDAEVNGSVKLDVTSDLEASYNIYCESDYINVKNNYIDYDVVLEEGQIKMMNGEDSYYGKQYKDVEAELAKMGFTNITTVPNYDIVYDITTPGSVKNVTIDGKDDYRRGNVFQNDVEIIITYSMKDDDDPEYIAEQKKKEEEKAAREKAAAEQAEKEKAAAEEAQEEAEKETNDNTGQKDESSNDVEAKDNEQVGSSGVYAYKKSGGSYDQYYIVDFSDGYVYTFTYGDGNEDCMRVKIESGNLNDGLKITFHDGGDSWSYKLNFKYKDQPSTLIVEDNDGFSDVYTKTNPGQAYEIKNKLNIVDY